MRSPSPLSLPPGPHLRLDEAAAAKGLDWAKATYRDSAISSDPFPIRSEFTNAVTLCSVCRTASSAGTAICVSMTCDRGTCEGADGTGRMATTVWR
jgi:hypothetical protein